MTKPTGIEPASSALRGGFFKKIIVLIFACDGSSSLRGPFLQLQGVGAALRCSAQASCGGGFSLRSTGSRA